MPPRIVVPLIGEPLPLDFVNTRPQPDRDVADIFATPDGLSQWLLVESDRLPTIRVTEVALTRVVALRAHVGAAIESILRGERPGGDAVDAINDALRRAPSYPQLSWGNKGSRLDTIRLGDHTAQLLAAIAEASVEYLSGNQALTTRRCAAPDCEMLFSLTHPRRQWCSPTVCGNRTRVARYYDRHKV